MLCIGSVVPSVCIPVLFNIHSIYRWQPVVVIQQVLINYISPIAEDSHPFCAVSLEQYYGWNIGKRRAAEVRPPACVLEPSSILIPLYLA